jgi:hypothetical protein
MNIFEKPVPTAYPYIKKLHKLAACTDALMWLGSNNYPTLKAAWNACGRANWLLWLVGRVSAGEPGSKARKRLLGCLTAILEAQYKAGVSIAPLHKLLFRNHLDFIKTGSTGEECYSRLLALECLLPIADSSIICRVFYAMRCVEEGQPANIASYAHIIAANRPHYQLSEPTLLRIVREHYPNPPRLGNP